MNDYVWRRKCSFNAITFKAGYLNYCYEAILHNQTHLIKHYDHIMNTLIQDVNTHADEHARLPLPSYSQDLYIIEPNGKF